MSVTLPQQAAASETKESTVINEFLHEGSICAVAPSERSRDPVWFMKIGKHATAAEGCMDKSGMPVMEGTRVFGSLARTAW